MKRTLISFYETIFILFSFSKANIKFIITDFFIIDIFFNLSFQCSICVLVLGAEMLILTRQLKETENRL